MFPMHNPLFIYPSESLLLLKVQAVILTDAGALQFNEEHGIDLLKGGERLGFFYTDLTGTIKMLHPCGSHLCDVHSKWEATTKLLQLFISQAKLSAAVQS